MEALRKKIKTKTIDDRRKASEWIAAGVTQIKHDSSQTVADEW